MRHNDISENAQEQHISVAEIAGRLCVSAASVRNWVKTGYLESAGKGYIARHSFEIFQNEIIGKSKLTKRANKSFADRHDGNDLIMSVKNELASGALAINIGARYENSLAVSHRNKEGIYYTPENICRAIFSDIPKPVSGQIFCDPCCGSGNFIIEAIRRGFSPENVYGYDTDAVAVEIAKRRIFEETGIISGTVICADFLGLAADVTSNIPEFDVIATNPPWGKKYSKLEKMRYGKQLGSGRGLDSSALFFKAALRVLKKDGFLALLLPEAFFKIAAFQGARSALLSYKILTTRNFGKAFNGLITQAQSFCLQKTQCQTGAVHCVTRGMSFKRDQASFAKNPAHIINFETCPEDEAVLAKVFSVPYVTLENNADWGLGIVTGNNSRFCRNHLAEGWIPVYKGADIHKTHLATPTNFIKKDFSLYQQVAPLELFEAKEKLIYRFISNRLVFYHDKNQSFFLNSANLVIPHKNFPIAQVLLAEILNTDLFSWIFQKIFSTHKILRADLEKLPLPIEFLQGKEHFSEQDLLAYYQIERGRNGVFRVKG